MGPSGAHGLHLPKLYLEDEDLVDDKVREVARFIASLVRAGHNVLVHCTEGLKRSGLVVARALLDLGWLPEDAIELVQSQRGLSADGFPALSNKRIVDWLVAEGGHSATEGAMRAAQGRDC